MGNTTIKIRYQWAATSVLAFAGVAGALAQAPAAATAPHATGTVKSETATELTVTTAGGDVTVTVPAAAKILDVAPGSHDLKSATPGQLSDIAVGDKVIVNGTAGDTATALTAQRIILMKSAAIAASHEAEADAWAHGSGGIVKSTGADTITLSSGLKTVTVQTTSATIVRRYAGSSVKFEDAVASTLGAIQPGDQLRVRGTKSADGSSIQADEIVAGSFRNYSGTIASIDGTAGTVTLKDLATKKTVTVAVTAGSDVRRLPPQAAVMMAARLRGGAAGGAGRPAGAAGSNAPAASAPAPAPAGEGDSAESGQRRAGRAAMDLSQMLSRLPTETLGGLKAGEAVMIVASAPAADAKSATAVTLLAGVEPLLAAQPAGESMTLSPWSVGGGAPDAGGGASQ